MHMAVRSARGPNCEDVAGATLTEVRVLRASTLEAVHLIMSVARCLPRSRSKDLICFVVCAHVMLAAPQPGTCLPVIIYGSGSPCCCVHLTLTPLLKL